MGNNKEKAIKTVNIKTDKKLRLVLTGISLLLAVLLTLLGCCFENIGFLFGGLDMGGFLLRFLLIIALFAACLAVNELIRRLLMKKLGVSAPTDKMSVRNFAVISFVPVLAVAIVLTVLLIVLTAKQFWLVYIIQVFNLCCAAGDVYTLILAKKNEADIIADSGDEIVFFKK